MGTVPAERPLYLPLSRAILATGMAMLVALGSATEAAQAQTAVPSPSPSATAPPATTTSAQPPATATPTPSPSSTATATATSTSTANQFKVTGTDGEGLRVRASASISAAILIRVAEGSTLTLAEGVAIEADNERWVSVTVAGTSGFAAARYLTRVATQAPVLKQLGPDASFGERAAAHAQSMIGQPYIWGGTKPGGFDCSGFVQWVYTQAGIATMARQIPGQLALGTRVDGPPQAGDLVTFVNTYTPGLSHAGVMINATQFVHAADESRGVMASELANEYWKSRFYQAVRLR